ncbi:hypothetical protein [Cedecea sp. P7760]|uniref:hypothetical protein n=1 Tax=Cedecea sp. P7760 TaxID=2726983 RepID=UPI0021031F35|nr:hypothetical protein [Cedecea sp. P7760]
MFRLTRVVLKSGEFSLFINGHYLAGHASGAEQLQEMADKLSRLPGVQAEEVVWPEPLGDDQSWADIGAAAIQNVFPRSRGTAGDLASHLLQYPADTLCLSSLWFEDDFLSLDDTLTPDEIAQAMDVADDRHDACIGLNWDSLQAAIDYVKGD